MSKPKGTKKPKQAVNQFLHSNRPSRAPKGNSENVEYDIEIRSPVYPPNENGVIIVKVQGQKDLGVQLQITNRFPSSVVLDRLTKKRKDLPMKPIKIQSGESVYHTVQVHINGLDHVYTYLNFDFHIKETGTKISKKIIISTQVFNPDVNELKPTSSYKRPPAAKFPKGVAPQIIYPAPRLVIEQRNDLPKIKLGQYFIPDFIRRMVNRGFREDAQEIESFLRGQRTGTGRSANTIQPENKYVVEIKNILKSKLTKDNYKEIFTLLLYFEEMQDEINMDRFTIEKTPMFCTEKEKEIFLTLEIAGIVDSSANICKYGTVGVRFIEDDGSLSTSMYEGNIKDFRTNTISLHFGKELRQIYYDDMQFQVHFFPSRHNIKSQHRALELIQKYALWPVLLPLNENIGLLGIKPLEIRNFFDKNIGKNHEQQTAVKNIVSGGSRPCPYIIFGPPGTGKTVTIVESMKQVISLDPESHILACAFSNAAADILLKKLLNFIPGIKLLRLYAVYVDYRKIPMELRTCSNFDEEGIPFYPSEEELNDYHIIISTVSTAGRLSSPELMGHFSHIFIDECGFCMEPEMIVAFAGILDLSKTQLVLAGDPKQLGPIVTSPFAREYKLDISLLERLMTTIPIYGRQADEKYDQRVITKLLKNYRSHPVILKVCNDLFYDNELQACANMRKVSEFCKWDVLPRTGFPLFIHSIVGEEQREGNCPSYYNSEEAFTAVEYIKKLQQHASQIGVITPYSKQVQKINILLQREKIKNVKVNSVEKFLGDEKKIIILSTVRSNPNDQENDYTNCMLGFLANKKRFNVAVSRPQALLIVVGNIKCLYSDPNWASLISYCQENEAIKGESLDSKREIIDFVTHKLAEQAITEPASQAEVS